MGLFDGAIDKYRSDKQASSVNLRDPLGMDAKIFNASTQLPPLPPKTNVLDDLKARSSPLETAKNFAQGAARSFGAAGAAINAAVAGDDQPLRAKFVPHGKIQEAIYGKGSFSLASEGSDVTFGLVPEESAAAPLIGAALSLGDLIPGGSAAKKALKTASSLSDLQKVREDLLVVDTGRLFDKQQVKSVTTDSLLAEDVAGYADLDAKRVKHYADALERGDQIDPLVVQVKDGNIFVEDGKHRLAALREKGVEQIDVVEKPFKAEGIERGFTGSVKELIPEASKVAGQYIPRSTDELSIKAKNEIAKNPERAEQIALAGSDEIAVAISSELLKKYAAEAKLAFDPQVQAALYDKAAEIANTIAPKLTEQGRAIQAASILSRLTPEGQLRFAAKEIQRYNKEVREGGLGGRPKMFAKEIPELTGEQSKQILDEMKAVENMPDGIERAMRFQKLQRQIQDLVPSPLWKKLTTIWKAGLLTGIKTSGLNLFSNLAHFTSEIAKDAPAAAVDSVASLFTGERTKTFTVGGTATGVKEGFEKGWRYLTTGFDERNIGQKLDYHHVNFGKGQVAKAFKAYTDTVFRILGSSDQPFYYGTLARSLHDQAFAQAKNAKLKGTEATEFARNLVENPTEEMVRYATADAATAVFQNETYLGAAAKKLQDIPVVGQITIPFARTPSSVAMQIINYTPVGIAKTIIENIGEGRFDQRLFSQGIGRGLTGTSVLFIGYKLGEAGLVSLDRPTTERERELWDVENRKSNAIKMGDKWRSPIVLGPAGNLLLIGAHFRKAFEENGSPTAAIAEATLGTAKSFTEQTFLTGLSNLLGAINDPDRFAEFYLSSLVGSVVPTLLADTVRAADDKERRTEDPLERVMSRLPWLRERLEPDVDVLGNERERVGNPLEVMADPTRPFPAKSSPVIDELRRLWDAGYEVSPTMLGDREGFKVLTQEQNTRLWKRAGEITNAKLNGLFADERYRKLSDDQKGDMVADFTQKAGNIARAEMAVELTDGLQGEELLTKLGELKADGLLTRAVFDLYQSVR